MTNHYAYQVHNLYRTLVSDIVKTLLGREWEMEKEVMDGLQPIPLGVQNMLIHLAVSDTGVIKVTVTENGTDTVKWLLNSECTGIVDVSHASIMSIGRLQSSFEYFWEQYVSKCTRIDMRQKRGAVRPPPMGNRTYFASQVTRSWLERGRLDLYIMSGQVRIGDDAYHTNRSWRRSVRALLGMDVQHEDAD